MGNDEKALTFEVLISMPMQEVPGKVILTIKGSALKGSIVMAGTKNDIGEGTVDNGNLNFTGYLKTPIGALSYNAAGTIIGDKLDLIAKTRIGDFIIKTR